MVSARHEFTSVKLITQKQIHFHFISSAFENGPFTSANNTSNFDIIKIFLSKAAPNHKLLKIK